MILLLDNYDSFTWNLVHYLAEVGAETQVFRNDALTAAACIAQRPDAVVISPGPCTPNEAGISLDLVQACAAARVPMLGVCLGHQSLGQAFGGTVIRAPEPIHGKISTITHTGHPLFAHLPTAFSVARYHSLVVRADDLPPALVSIAHTADGLIMALAHQDLPLYGVQFHPESIASEGGHQILANFLALARGEVPVQLHSARTSSLRDFAESCQATLSEALSLVAMQ
jgi:anthranilate synthase component II